MARLGAFVLVFLVLCSHGLSNARTLSDSSSSGGLDDLRVSVMSLWGPAISLSYPGNSDDETLTTYATKMGDPLYFSLSTTWSSLGGIAASKPATARNGDTSLVSVVGDDDKLWYITQAHESYSDGLTYWVTQSGRSCMDNDGENYKIFRKVSFDTCLQYCKDDPQCVAVTHNPSNSCYLKKSCSNIVARNNGDNSAILHRGRDTIRSGASWLDRNDLSCMDNDGENYKIYRRTDSMDDCKQYCVDDTECQAVTYSSSDNCYLKKSCQNLVARDNGDNSAVLIDRRDDTSSWEVIPEGECISAPAVAAVQDRFDVLCVGTDNQPYAHQIIDGSPSGDWVPLGGGVMPGTSPAATGNTDSEKTMVVVVGMDGRLWWKESNSDGSGWGSWSSPLPEPDESVRGSPALAYADGNTYLFVVGVSGRPYYMTLDEDGDMSDWTRLGDATCISDMAATTGCSWGESDCVTAACFGTDDQLWRLSVSDGGSFGAWTATGLLAP